MAESTLALDFPKLQSKIGDFLGYGRGVTFLDPEWDTRQVNDILDVIESAQRRFYQPATNPPYRWSFLRPMAAMTLAEGAQTIELPDDFAGVEGRIAMTDDAQSLFIPIDFQGEGAIQQMYSSHPTMTGRPLAACVRPLRGTAAQRSQRYELFVFPTSDAAYTLHFQYYLAPNAITITRPFAYGGAEHAETMLEACLAVAEERRDDMQGVHAAAFMARLQASIALDMAKKPQQLGYNRDQSDDMEWRIRQFNNRLLDVGPVTINGIAYD